VALGGEASSPAEVRALWEAAPGIRVFNRYGPTETTIAVTHIELTPELLAGGTVPIGCPHPGSASTSSTTTADRSTERTGWVSCTSVAPS